MPADATGRRHGTRIRSDRLLLVEGRDEVYLFEALMKHCLGPESMVQVIDAGGKDRFPKNLRALQTASRPRPSLRAIGVVRDADENAAAAFQSVCDHLRNVGYQPPPDHGGFSDGVPSVGVFIVPDGEAPGAIETLCRRSRAGDDVSGCVDEYLRCLHEHEAMHSTNVDKTFAHAYLTAMDDPVARVGEGALQGVWDFGSPVFSELSGFLRRLAAIDIVPSSASYAGRS